MSALSIQPTYPIFTETDGQPLENGYIWIGTVNLDPQVNPINVYFDAALTIQAAQPIRTINGYPSRNGTPARLYVNSDYSIRVMNKNGSVVYSAPAATERYENIINSSDIIYEPAGVAAIQTNVQAKLRTYIDAQDYIASPGASAVTDLAGVQAAVDYAASIGGAVVRVRPPITTSWNLQSLTVPVGVMIEDLRRMATNNIFIYGVGGDTEFALSGTSVSGGEGPSFVAVNNATTGDRTSSLVSRYGNTGIGGNVNCYMHMGVWDNPNWWPEFDMITNGDDGFRSNLRVGYGVVAINAGESGAQYYTQNYVLVVQRPPNFTKSGKAFVVGDTVSEFTTELKVSDTNAAVRICYADGTPMWSWIGSFPSVGQLTLYDHDTSSNRLVFSTGVTTHLGRFETTTAKLTPTTVASLPSATTVGAGGKAFVSDANATTFASIVAGGGSNNVPVYSDGTNWRIG